MAEREGIAQLPYYDNPKALELARIASEQMGRNEFTVDKQYPLPPEARFGGIYGTVSGIGDGGDYPQTGKMATIRAMGAPTRDKGAGFLNSTKGVTLGEYFPKAHTPESIALYNRHPDFQPGIAPGSVHYFQNRDVIARETQAIDTPEQADRQIASTINHELLHRGADVLPLDALEKYANQREADEGPWDRIKYRRAADTFKRLKTGEGQHIYTKSLRKFIDPKQEKKRVPIVDKNRLDELAAADEVMREFFTPERQEQYQIRLPTRSAEPKEKGLGALFRRLFD